jgi:flagellar basal-body rod protein FlgB
MNTTFFKEKQMDISNSLQNKLMTKTTKILSRVMDFRSANQEVISENLANIDTPGYKPKELRFDQELKRAAEKDQIQLKTTKPGHLSHQIENNIESFPIQEVGSSGKGESNELNLDMEMAKMMRNNLLYDASAKLIAKKFKSLRSAIEGR